MSSHPVRCALPLLSSLLVLALTATSAGAAPPTAKISEATAQATALAKVPGGRVKAHELEREKGLLIYSFDIVVAGRPGIEEVNVNALDGSIVAVRHEDPAAERLEAKQDRAEKAASHVARSATTHAARKPLKSRSAARDSAKTR